MMPIPALIVGAHWGRRLFLSLNLLFPSFVNVLVFPQPVQNCVNSSILRNVSPKAEKN